tara:strand:- start:798 stop:992 length:195 start_codon:yes stop_codon:yes gene_type:complete
VQGSYQLGETHLKPTATQSKRQAPQTKTADHPCKIAAAMYRSLISPMMPAAASPSNGGEFPLQD